MIVILTHFERSLVVLFKWYFYLVFEFNKNTKCNLHKKINEEMTEPTMQERVSEPP